MNSRGWTSSETDLQRIRFLDWVYDNTRRGTVPRGRTYMDESGVDGDTLDALAAYADDAGLALIDHSMGGVGA